MLVLLPSFNRITAIAPVESRPAQIEVIVAGLLLSFLRDVG